MPAALAAATGMLWLQSALAGPADYVYTPTVVAGEREIDFKAGSADADPRRSAAMLGLGYGANDWWFTEAYLKYAKEGSASARYDAFEWENKFQLTETGKYPFEFGLLAEVEIPRDRDEGFELKAGTLLQTELGKIQLNGNLLFENHFRSTEPSRWEMGYQWQVKYRWQRSFEYGLQGFGEMGEWNDWESFDAQSHKAGPAVFGMFRVSERTSIRYNAAWLIGWSESAPHNTARLQIEYEF